MKQLLAGLTALTIVGGCGAPDPSGGGTTGDIELAAVNVAHVTGSTEDAAAAGSAINDFGMALYQRIAADDPSANLVVSPASIALALSMARAGARGQTAAEMDAVLQRLGTDEHAAWVAALDRRSTLGRDLPRRIRRDAGCRAADRQRAVRPAGLRRSRRRTSGRSQSASGPGCVSWTTSRPPRPRAGPSTAG